MKGQQSAAAEPAGSRGAAAGTDMACRALGAGACCGGDGTCGGGGEGLGENAVLERRPGGGEGAMQVPEKR